MARGQLTAHGTGSPFDHLAMAEGIPGAVADGEGHRVGFDGRGGIEDGPAEQARAVVADSVHHVGSEPHSALERFEHGAA
jgi:hypothetical protein